MASTTSPFELLNQSFPITNYRSSLKAPRKNQQRQVSILSSLNGAIPFNTKALRVAYQGIPGAYSEFAAKTAYPDCTTISCRAFSDVIEAIETGRADRAVIPVESTMQGTALRNYDLLLQNNMLIVQEINLFVHYCLLAMPGVRKKELKRVISHPMALAHCGRTLAELGLHREAVEDTAGAVKLLLSENLLDTAAIASSQAALLYGLDVVAHGLQDESWNVTRFLILAKDSGILKNCSRVKTSLVVGHHGWSLSVLLKVLSAFSYRNVSLTKLEVNPYSEDDGPVKILDVNGGEFFKEFPCVLFVDFEGSMDDQKVKEAIEEISESSVFVRILGSYAADTKIYGLE